MKIAAIHVQLTWFGTNQKRSGHQAQSDWSLFARTFILNLDNTVNLSANPGARFSKVPKSHSENSDPLVL